MGNWKRRRRRPPWVDPAEYRAMRWTLNSSFWKSVGVNIVSAAIIALGSTYFLALAIYSKVNRYHVLDQINGYYIGLMSTLTVLAIAYFYYRAVHGLGVLLRIMGIFVVVVGIFCVGLFLYMIVDLQITNLVNTLPIPEHEGPLPNSRVFPHLLFDEFGNPRYMDDVPYTAG